ncbi:retron St85 family RNA-directed DNA polymerase [Pseudomonas sp. RTC3]|uniref:retron St85 family RNA-directed DNA polymerase n=1 Tax=Pseudomonas sp. 5C2 TaxID=3048588 RepID=UPI002AB4D6E0|nr:retron St85 family RNA-directed DNA polymerase [Pseudomonas sp. 5C2]MDY7566833.1 retron St85 family RNA-directed DNA polymerase [Pseudomonas sp. 5C2]MEB0065184.1 retron St85 family RNA-directed DNA polymerase [Pseudomonas sp. RTC3]MEB0243847.1 retron St85 family RNA-directed DNA polymerase [Pseudomonas sp. 5C2]
MNILASLSSKLLISSAELIGFVNTAPYRYKVYPIPKRSGRGVRIIAQPTDVLKVMQRMVLESFLVGLPIHHCATAYRDGVGIRENASEHLNSKYLLKMDFSDFFPSIGPTDLISHIKKHKGEISREDAYAVKKLFFWARKKDPVHKLSIGAPSSPFISNTLMYEFDCRLFEECARLEVSYTRYADDLTFTTNTQGVLFEFPSLVAKICREIDYPTLRINAEKTVFSSKGRNRHVTGLVLTNDDQISLGHDKKRYIRSLIYRYTLGGMSSDEVYSLKGVLAFAKHVEPGFYQSAVRKYGEEVVSSIMSFQLVK